MLHKASQLKAKASGKPLTRTNPHETHQAFSHPPLDCLPPANSEREERDNKNSSMSNGSNMQGPPSTASIEAAAKAASQEMVDPEVRGDPRMNRAVQAKLKNPHVSLSDALRIGGFEYAPRATASAMDNENVTLGQRKNQLNRRLRQARLNQAAAMERAAVQAGMSDAGSVCGSVASAGTSVSGATGSVASHKRSAGAAQFLASLQGDPKRPNVFTQLPTPIQALQAQADAASVASFKSANTSAPTASSVNTSAAPQQALIGQPPHILDQLLHMQSLQQTPPAHMLQQQQQQQQQQQTTTASSGLLQQQLAGFQPEPPQQQSILQPPPPQPPQPNNALQQLLASTTQAVQQASNNTGGAISFGNNQYLVMPASNNDQQAAQTALLTAITSTLKHNNNNSNTSSDVEGRTHTVVTNSTTGTGPSPAANVPPTDAANDDNDVEEEDDEVDDDRLEAGLQIFSREIRNLYQSCMLKAGFAPGEVHESNQTYHNFAFHAWRRECQTLQKLIRQDPTAAAPAPSDDVAAAVAHFSSNQSTTSYHTTRSHQTSRSLHATGASGGGGGNHAQV